MKLDNQIDRVPDAVLIRPRRGALSRVFGSLLGLILLVAISLITLAAWGWTVFTADGPLAQAKIIDFPQGASRTEIANRLKSEGVISNVGVMNAASILNGLRGTSLKSGEYEFKPGMTMASVFGVLSSGKVIIYKLTVPEGWTSVMALARINNNDVLVGDPVTEANAPEGAILADTFIFRRGKTRKALLDEMINAQATVAEELWAKRPANTILKSKQDFVTLASIVEKETAKAEERPRVAAVFLNRLKKGMRLQSDPTIIYGLVGGLGKLDRALTRADIDGPTPYNTYQIDGLPPTAIANPGRAAMESVIAPAPSDDLYFVADGSGGHAFAATLEGHNENVKKWRDFQKNGLVLPGDSGAEGNTPIVTQEPGKLSPEIAQQIEQPELPSGDQLQKPADAPADTAAADDTAIDEAAATAKKVQVVPPPVDGADAVQAGDLKPVAAEPPPLPVAKKPKIVAAAATPDTAEVPAKPVLAPVEKATEKSKPLTPGSVVKVGERLIPIPQQKKKKK